MASRHMILGTVGLLVLCSLACDTRPSPSGPSALPPATPPPTPPPAMPPVAAYAATFTASATCASALRPDARQRTYTATLRQDGTIEWSGPTLNPPSGHRPISSGVLSGDLFSFSIDVERDPQSDDFHGLWEDFGSGQFLNISGKGSGAVHGAEITGTFDGLFAFYEPVNPPQPGVLITGAYCRATNHQFRLVKQ